MRCNYIKNMGSYMACTFHHDVAIERTCAKCAFNGALGNKKLTKEYLKEITSGNRKTTTYSKNN